MKKVVLKSLELTNWRAQSRKVIFDGNAEIHGRNKEGKSTVFNAFLWLLTGYDEYDRSNYNVFNNTIEQTYENAAPAIVEGIFDINGNEYKFRREARQGWVRPRGKSEYERKGSDDYKFFVDGIEVSAGNYKSTIEGLFVPIDKLKILLNVRYFLTMDWKEMRKQLEAMVGNIQESDFKGDYTEILSDLMKYNTDQLKTSYAAKKREINKDIDSLPITIEALKSNLPDMEGVDEAQKVVDDCNAEIEKLMEEMQGKTSSLQPYIDKRNEELKEIASLEEAYSKAESAYKQNYFDELSKCLSEIKEIEHKNAQIEHDNRENKIKHDTLKVRIENKEKELKELKAYRETLLEQNKKVKELVFNEDKCPYCGQELPEDKLEEQRTKFNENKEAKHKAILAEGKSNNVKIQACQDEIKRLTDESNSIPASNKTMEDVTKAAEQYNHVKVSFVPYEQTEEGKAKKEVIKAKKELLTDIPEIDNSEFLTRKGELTLKKDNALRKLGLKEEYDRQVAKIASLQEELKANTAEVVKIEGKIAKVKEYEQERADIVNMRVSNKFHYISVKMSELNKSGDYVPACIITDNEGVNALVANNASRILCGIDLSLSFQDYYGVSIPMFIDNAESVNEDNYPEIPCQVIKMFVDECKFTIKND